MLFVVLSSISALAQSYMVTNGNDSGPGSFRAAIEKANMMNRGGSILFNLDVGESQVIVLHSSLPEIVAQNLTIDGRDKRSGVIVSLDGRNSVLAPPIVFKFGTSRWMNLDFINFVDESIFMNPEDEIEIVVYPNPNSQSMVTVEIKNIPELHQPVLVDLTNMEGSSIQSQYLVNQANFLVANLELGEEMPDSTYLVNVRIGERTYQRKLVVR